MAYQMSSDLESEFSLRMSQGGYASIEQVLRTALSALDARDREIAAIQEGIDAMERGDVRSLQDFNREFRAANNIPMNR
jgi:hypothetical protein